MKTQNIIPNPAVCRDVALMMPGIVEGMLAEAKQTRQVLTKTIKNDKGNFKIDITAYPQGFAEVDGMTLDENYEPGRLIIRA